MSVSNSDMMTTRKPPCFLLDYFFLFRWFVMQFLFFTVFCFISDQNNKRIVLALQSGLKSELTWALNTLTLLSFKEKDEVRKDATPLAKIPGLLDALLQVVGVIFLSFCIYTSDSKYTWVWNTLFISISFEKL